MQRQQEFLYIYLPDVLNVYDGQNGRRKNDRFELKFYEFIEQTKKTGTRN